MSTVRLSPIASALSVAALALLATACDRSFDVTWTVQGQPASEACAGLGDRVVLASEWRDSPAAEPRRHEAEASCADGTAKINAGNDAQLVVELLRGDTVVGSATPALLDATATSPVSVDISLHTGELAATLNVLQRSCGDAGATRFSVKLREDVGLNGRVIDEKEVTCQDGVAVYHHPAVKLGGRYFVAAETTIGDERYHVTGPGHAVLIDKPRTETTVNLRGVGGQPGRDAGEPGYIDAGPGPDASADLDAGPGTDAGHEVDAGDETDAGHDVDAGDETDAGAGVDAGDEADAGDDAGVCVPDCVDRECGDDGCGGSCGSCTLGLCVVDQCVLG